MYFLEFVLQSLLDLFWFRFTFNTRVRNTFFVALLKAQVSLQLGKIFSSDDEVSLDIMYGTDFYSNIQLVSP